MFFYFVFSLPLLNENSDDASDEKYGTYLSTTIMVVLCVFFDMFVLSEFLLLPCAYKYMTIMMMMIMSGIHRYSVFSHTVIL